MQEAQMSNEIVAEVEEVRRESAVEPSQGTELSTEIKLTRSSTPIPQARFTVPAVRFVSVGIGA